MKLLKKFSILSLSILLISNYFIINGYSIKKNNIEIIRNARVTNIVMKDKKIEKVDYRKPRKTI